MTGVLVADDHPMLRSAIARVISDAPDMEVLAQAGDGITALASIEQHEPAVAVVDMRMPGMTGAEVCDAVRERGLRTRVLVFSASDDPVTVRRVMAAGAAGFVSKHADHEQIRDAIRRAAAA